LAVPVVNPLRPALCSLALLGCGADSLPHPTYGAQPPSALAPIDSEPPPGRVELVPAMPANADAWIPGEWILRHGRWYWLLGRWVKAPPGATYRPWMAVRARDGSTLLAPSSWTGPDGKPIPAPPAIAYATASGEAVFDAQGEKQDTGRAIENAPRPPAPETSPLAPDNAAPAPP
jgi:hypothetical protein